MAEVHPDPSIALSDQQQQMDIPTFNAYYDELLKFMKQYDV